MVLNAPAMSVEILKQVTSHFGEVTCRRLVICKGSAAFLSMISLSIASCRYLHKVSGRQGACMFPIF
jgi:hypothetical protein